MIHFRFTDEKSEHSKFAQLIAEKLPFGSGFDYVWGITDKGKYVKATSAFTVYNNVGYRMGAADFSLIIFKKRSLLGEGTSFEFSVINFNLHFHGSQAQYFNQYYMLRSYLEDTIHFCLND